MVTRIMFVALELLPRPWLLQYHQKVARRKIDATIAIKTKKMKIFKRLMPQR